MHNKLIKRFGLVMLTSFYTASVSHAVQPVPDSQDDTQIRIQEAKATTLDFLKRLGKTMKQEMQNGGPTAAIKVCRDVAPSMANEISLSKGWKVTRIGTRVRNPMIGMPDAWEQQILNQFTTQMEKGKKPNELTHFEVVKEPNGHYLRFMKAIGTQPICLTCHGAAEDIDASVKAKLLSTYPFDKAIGYKAGDLRGAVSIKQPLNR